MPDLKSLWRKFRADRPGQRFQNLYHRRRNEETGRFPAERLLNAGAGIALIVVGLILVPAPGPGWLIAAVGCGLVASEFLFAARFLDSAEVKIRSWLPAKKPRQRRGQRRGRLAEPVV